MYVHSNSDLHACVWIHFALRRVVSLNCCKYVLKMDHVT